MRPSWSRMTLGFLVWAESVQRCPPNGHVGRMASLLNLQTQYRLIMTNWGAFPSKFTGLNMGIPQMERNEDVGRCWMRTKALWPGDFHWFPSIILWSERTFVTSTYWVVEKQRSREKSAPRLNFARAWLMVPMKKLKTIKPAHGIGEEITVLPTGADSWWSRCFDSWFQNLKTLKP